MMGPIGRFLTGRTRKLKFYGLDAGSRKKLKGVDARLLALVTRVAEIMPIRVLEGLRSLERQQMLIDTKASKIKDPWNGKHIHGMAVDIVPLPIDWDKQRHFDHLGGVVRAIAAELGVPLRWGGDWNRNWDLYDQEFNDLCHFELNEPVPEKPLT